MPPEPNTVSLRQQRLEEEVLNYLKAVDAGQAPDRQEVLARHPEMAADLKAFFADQDGIQSAVGQLRGPAAEPRPAFSRRIFGNYELLKVIGEGGMGIVFKARQFSPPRVVVLKMIRAGQLASPEDRQRFRTEAEFAATLDHPSIVPIYEVGEHDGQPYFSMKRIEGGSLAQHLRLFVNSPKASARLVAKVARAVHHANQRGILHRDLKPANILLDGRGKPYVTDFGLAKLLEGDAGLTQTGAIVGTIGNMSPEQAAAKKDLTAAVDVYGLGTILYELLTGQPLFRAETVVEMLRQVQEREPKRPRVLRPRLDRDLETICLKCLEKDPGKRYGSAEELAEDLDHWLAGELIEGRRSGLMERAIKWAKRRPAVVALIAVSCLALFGGIGLMAALWAYAEKLAAALRDLNTAQIKLNESQDQLKGLKITVEESAAKYGWLYERRAGMYAQMGKYDEAIADCAEAIKLPGDHLHETYFTRGCIYEIKRENEKAIADLSEAIRIRPTFPEPYKHRGQIYVNLRQLDKAAADYRKLLDLGEMYMQLGKYEEAIDDCTHALKLPGDHLHDIYFTRGRVYEIKGEYEKAIADLSEAIKIEPQSADLYLHRGHSYARKNLHDQAVADYTRGLECNPESGSLYAYRAESYNQVGKYDEAIADCAEALKLPGDHLHHTYFTRGCVYEIKGDYERALADLREAIRIGPDYTEPYKHRGAIYVHLRQWNKAAADYDKLLELQPSNHHVWFESACLRVQLGDTHGYRELCTRMLKQFGQSKDVNDIAVLAHTWVLAPQALADAPRVRQLAEQRLSLPLQPIHNLWSSYVLGLAYYRTGLNDKAVECLAKGVEDHPGWEYNVSNWLVLAMAHQRLRDAAEARQYLDKAREWIRLKTESMPAKGGGFAPPGWNWWDWLGLQMLHQEAEALILENRSR